MTFFLRKLLAEILMPFPMLLTVGIAGWVLWTRGSRVRLGRGFVAASFAGMTVLSLGPVAGGLIGIVEGPPRAFDGDSVSHVVVLGGGHVSNPALPPTAWLESQSIYRLAEGVRLVQAQPWATLIVSGYSGRDARTQADVAREVALALGVDADRIVAEGRGRTTAEEAMYLEPILAGARFALVTSASHMPRAAALFRARGLDPVEAPTGHLARDPGAAYDVLAYVPNERNLLRARAAWYEVLSSAWARLSGDS